MAIKILKNGILDTVQDSGRIGYRAFGFGPGGPMDPTAFMIANILVGNDSGAGALEFSFPSPELEFTKASVISICGGEFSPSINGIEIDTWCPVLIRKGDRLTFKKNIFGRFAYLAVSGGILSEMILGSVSTNPKVPIGERCGRALLKGETIEIGVGATDVLGRVAAGQSIRPRYSDAPTIRVTRGPEFHSLDSESIEKFDELDFKVTNSSDRMGYRMSGSIGEISESSSMLSSPVTFGTIQVPPDGNPIALMADHQTTGGYPRVAQILMTDLPLLAQLQPGKRLGFKIVNSDHAAELLMERNRDLRMLALASRNILK